MAIASMASDHAEELGAKGAIDQIIRNIEQDVRGYGQQGARALINLVAHETNRHRARAIRLEPRLKEVMSESPSDGTLQWRGSQVLAAIELKKGEVEELVTNASAPGLPRRNSKSKYCSAKHLEVSIILNISVKPNHQKTSRVRHLKLLPRCAEGVLLLLTLLNLCRFYPPTCPSKRRKNLQLTCARR